MPGGLIQLITTGIQDERLTYNPEITFFKTIFKRHTTFSIWQNNRYLGNMPFNKKDNKVLEKNGDLLSSLYFKLEIPNFQIIKNNNITNITNNGYNVNSLITSYVNTDCLVFFCINSWYIIPKYLFKLNQFFNYFIEEIDSSELQINLLPNIITEMDLDQYVSFYMIQDNNISPLISALRINSSYWEQYWLDILSVSSDIMVFNSLYTLLYDYSKLYLMLKQNIYNNYYINTFLSINTKYFNFAYTIKDLYDIFGNPIIMTETERYLEYINTNNVTQLSTLFDIDVTYNFCKYNLLNFNKYQYNTLYNSLVINLILNMIYSGINTNFTFWKKYDVNSSNIINNNIIVNDNNTVNEWLTQLSSNIDIYLNTSTLNNIILNKFIQLYNFCETEISSLYSDLSFNNTANLYIKLKVIFNRFYQIPNMQLNFNDYNMITNYDNDNIITDYNNDNYEYLLKNEQNNYSKLNNLYSDLSKNEIANLSPVDLKYIYVIIAIEIANNTYKTYQNNLLSRGLQSFIVLWRNTIMNRLYQRFIDNNTLFKNVMNNTTNANSFSRYMLFYNSITPTNDISFKDFNNSYYEMFYKNSFFTSINLDNNDLLKFNENTYMVNKTLTSNGNFNKLSIRNKYTYTNNINKINNFNYVLLDDFNYDTTNNILYIRYDNFYDNNSKIILYINNIETYYSDISYVIQKNEYNFNSIYLAFSVLITDPKINTISLDVTYNTMLPTICFDSSQSFVIDGKYYLFNESVNNIINNNLVNIDNTLASSTNIKVLTINYFKENTIYAPVIDLSWSFIDSNYNNVTEGTHMYAISYYSLYEESDISTYINITIDMNKQVNIMNIPISSDLSVIGRKIYRTKQSNDPDKKFYLLASIEDNITRTFIDNINDTNLGVAYDINGYIKYNLLPESNGNTIKFPINIEPSNNYYALYTYDGSNILLQNNIKDMYIEDLSLGIIEYDSNNFNVLNIDNTYIGELDIISGKSSWVIDISNSNFTYSSDYLYYLINNNNFQDSCKLVSTKVNTPITPPHLELISDLSSTLEGRYYYAVTFYNNITKVESHMSDPIYIDVSNNTSVIITNFPVIYDSMYNSWNLYGTTDLSNFYLVANITTPSYNDNKYISLSTIYNGNQFYMTSNINTNKIQKSTTPFILSSKNGMIEPGVYNYFYTYIDNNNNESLPSLIQKILIDISSNITIYDIQLPLDRNISYINIYRSKSTQELNMNYYLITQIYNNYYTDTTSQQWLEANNTPIDMNKFKTVKLPNYSILQVPIKNIVPNLNSYLSQSTDFNFINDKKISDLNDGLFNKSFIMMTTQNSNNGYLYFYNINFKINETSIILLNDVSANFLLPISSQQFFIKDPSENYYYIDGKKKQANNNMVIQNTFNPSFDPFNIPISFLSNGNYYYNVMIDNMICNIDILLNLNSDYMKAINIINNTYDLYVNIFKKIFNYNTLYGLTSQQILDNIDKINESPIMNNSSLLRFNYNNLDYSYYSHSIINTSNALDNFTHKNITLLTPVYLSYNANNKLSKNLLQYFSDVNRFFNQHIMYVNANIDYLNIANPNNYNEKYYSYQEIQENVIDKYNNYTGENTLTLLQPMLDPNLKSNIYKLIITNENNDIYIINKDGFTIKEYTNTNIVINNNPKYGTYTKNKIQNNYTNSKILQYDTNMKFNYIGLISVDNSSNFIFNDTYLIMPIDNAQNDAFYKLDDNNIYSVYVNLNLSRYSINVSNRVVINPYILSIDPSYNNIDITYISNMYIYKIKIYVDSNVTEHTNFLINNNIIEGYYDNSTNILSFITLEIINFDSMNLTYQQNYDNKSNKSWITQKIISCDMIQFKTVNYFCNESLNSMGIETGKSLYKVNDTYYDTNDIIEFNNNCYFYITDLSLSFISIYNDVEYTLKPSMKIIDNTIYPYINTILLDKKSYDFYILLVDLSKKRQFIMQIKDMSYNYIPESNYQVWLYDNSTLNLIPYNVSISIDINGNIYGLSNKSIPTYSYYMIKYGNDKSCIYYYESGDTIHILDGSYNYYSIKDVSNITQIYLIDNMIFNTNSKQLLGIQQTMGRQNNIELFINKQVLSFSNNTFDSYNDLVYNSRYINNTFYLKNISKNSNIIDLLGSNEVLVSMILQDSSTNDSIYMPLIITTYNDITIPQISFLNSNGYNIYTSFITYNYDNYHFDNNILVNNIYLGHIVTDDTIYSMSPEITINSNHITLNSGFYINDINYNLNLWKLKGITKNTGSIYYFYFWTLFTTDQSLIDIYSKNNIDISQPQYLDQSNNLYIPNYFKNYNLVSAYPNIVDQSNNNMIYHMIDTDKSKIYYKYYTDTRYSDSFIMFDYNVKLLDFNSIINIKPMLHYLSNNMLVNNIIYYIVINNNDISVVNYSTTYKLDYNNTYYYSLEYPYYIYNDIRMIYISDNLYQIISYKYLFLQTNEIIMVDNCYFLVKGCNFSHNNNYYYDVIILQQSNSNNLRYNYSGYYSLGNYTSNNNMMPELDYMNTLVYRNNTINVGDIYMDNSNNLIIATKSEDLEYIYTFTESPLKIKLFVDNSNNLYLFDNFVKLKIMDKIIYNKNNIYDIYEIVNIRDNMIFLNKPFTYEIKFVDFILPYQPFNISYVNFDISLNFNDNVTLVINDPSNDNIMNTYVVIDNKLYPNVDLSGSMMVRIYNTNYTATFENKLLLNDKSNININNMYPIEISCDVSNNMLIFNNFDIYTQFFYLQPIKILGTFNYIKSINNNIITLLYPITIKTDRVNIILSPFYNTIKEYYGMIKFRYNFGIESIDYDNLSNINVTQYILRDDELIFIENVKNFQYGVKNQINESNNNIVSSLVFSNVYFYNNMYINRSGTISNFDTTQGSYHIITEYDISNNANIIHLSKILYNNKIKLYTPVKSYNNKFYIDKLIQIILFPNDYFTYITPAITQSNLLLEINKDKVQIISSYNINFIDYPEISGNIYVQKAIIDITNDFYYSYIYTDPSLNNKYPIKIDNNIIYIYSDSYISNDIKTIYTVYDNYLLSSTMSNESLKKLQLNDMNIYNMIISPVPIVEYLSFNMLLSTINSNIPNYYSYNFIDNNKIYNMSSDYSYVYNPNNTSNITFIDQNNRTLNTIYTIDNNILLTSSDYINYNLYIINFVDTTIMLDSNILLENAKQLRINLLNNSTIKDYNLFNSIKPWDTWSLLSGINGSTNILANKLVSQASIQWKNNSSNIVYTQDPNISYLTNDEIKMLSAFMETIYNTPQLLQYYLDITNNLVPLIYDNLRIWLNNPQFFLHVTEMINEFIHSFYSTNISFDGNNLVYNKNIIIPSISNEYTFDISSNSIYRSSQSYNNISTQINIWMAQVNIVGGYSMETKNFGLSINKILKYLRELGDNMTDLLNNFIDPLIEDVFDPSNNPLNFWINKVWENNSTNTNLQILNKDQTYYGDNTSLFPYTISFIEDQIFKDASYSVHYVNGSMVNTTDISFNPEIIYPDQLNFNSKNNITPSEFILVKKKITYDISSYIYLGELYQINFTDPNFDISMIDTIYWNNNNLTIKSIDISNNNIIVYIPSQKPPDNSIFEIRNMMGIISIEISDTYQYITFYNNSLISFYPNKTFLKTNTNTYLLQYDSKKYYIIGPMLDTYDVTIINTIDVNAVPLMQYAYNFTLNKDIDKYYDLVPNNSIIPMDFQLVNTSKNTYNPILVQTLQSNIIQLIFDNHISNPNYIINTQCVSTNFTNKINDITKYNEYMYNINNIIPSTYNTHIIIYDSSNIIIDQSIYFNNTNNVTSFTLSKEYSFDEITNYCYIQKNTWDISTNNYAISNNYMSINVPDDFILNTDSNFKYMINAYDIDKKTFTFMNDILSFQFNYDVSGNIVLSQSYINTIPGKILIPDMNQKVALTLDYPMQYTANMKYYVLPISIDDMLYNTYMYKIKTNKLTNLNGFRQVGFGSNYQYPDKNIILYSNGTSYNGLIFDEYHDGSYVNLIISLNNPSIDFISIYSNFKEPQYKPEDILPPLDSVWTYSLSDKIIKPVIKLSSYMVTFQFANYYNSTDISLNTVNMFISSDINNYNIIPTYIYSALVSSKFYLVSYTDYTVINKFYPNIFIQDQSMKQNITYSNLNNTITELPQFTDYSKFFSYIRFYINDMLIEELNEDVFNINYYLYLTTNQKNQFDNVVKIIPSTKGWELRIPLEFWFNNIAAKAIPIIALPYSELRLEYKLNDIKNILSNDLSVPYTFSTIPSIKINLNTDYILLDTEERKLFGSYAHEYVIDRYKTYINNTIYYDISNNINTIYKKWSGLVKDIYFIAKPINYPGLSYIPQITYNYDSKYARYTTALKYTANYIANNNSFTPITKQYSRDITIVINNTNELNTYITTHNMNARIQNLYNVFSTWAIWDASLNLLKYLMYYEDYYLYLIKDIGYKNKILGMYLQYIYSTKKVINKISPIKSIRIKANGTDLFAKRDYNYFTNVIPAEKFMSSLPIGYYCYSFSLYPKDEQWSGHLNFTNIDNTNITIESNYGSNNEPEPYQLSSVLKEYNILRIMSGMGALAWID
jgi:hypothetical protein